VKLLSRASDQFVFRFDSREYDALMAALGLRAHLPRGRRSLTADTPKEPQLREAQEDLDAALAEHRQHIGQAVESLLGDPEKCVVHGKGARVVTLKTEEVEQVLQALNNVRVAAWERLGSPDFEAGQRPEVNDENFLCLWTIQATDLFQSFLLAALEGES
jgi:hypothetical protein